MLSQIALSLWSASPWVGMGAGTFVERVGATRVFLVEYGAPLDSHGWMQKLLAETGIVGIIAATCLVWTVFQFVRRIRTRLHAHHVDVQIFTLLAIASFGALVYQLFNTSYWNAKMWLPLGILLAASRALVPHPVKEEREEPMES
jgi:O-antigen ligase